MKNLKKLFVLFSAFSISGYGQTSSLPVEIDFKLEGLPDLKNKNELDNFIANAKSETIPKLLKMHECVQKTKLVTESYKEYKTLSFGKSRQQNILIIEASPGLPRDYQFNMNILDNFSALERHQSNAMSEIESFHYAMKLPENPTEEVIKSRLSIIDAKIENLMTKVASSAMSEDAFLFLIDRSRAALEKIRNENKEDLSFVLSQDCKNVPVSPVATYVTADLIEMSEGIGEMKAIVVQIRDRRHKMIDYLYNYHRYKLTSAYYQNLGDSLENLQDKITSVFATARLVEEMNGWWQGVLTRGLADNYQHLYLKYDETLRRLQATREKAHSYLDRVSLHKESPESMKIVFRQQVNNILSIIDRNIDKLVKSGWEGQFKQQQLMVDYMVGIQDKYVKECAPLLLDFKKNGTLIQNADQFHMAENWYENIINSCVTKRAN